MTYRLVAHRLAAYREDFGPSSTGQVPQQVGLGCPKNRPVEVLTQPIQAQGLTYLNAAGAPKQAKNSNQD